MSQLMFIPIASIHYTTKKRRGVSPHRVEELRRELESGYDMPPIKVHAHGDGTYTLEDGRHRVQAHLAAGLSNILASVTNLLGRMCRLLLRLFI